ncbi:jg23926, partial [Pararge aegeria aegeria]
MEKISERKEGSESLSGRWSEVYSEYLYAIKSEMLRFVEEPELPKPFYRVRKKDGHWSQGAEMAAAL